jgi:hypothetical protein
VAKVGDLFGEALTTRPTTARVLARAQKVLDTTLTATPPQRGQKRRGRGGTRA